MRSLIIAFTVAITACALPTVAMQQSDEGESTQQSASPDSGTVGTGRNEIARGVSEPSSPKSWLDASVPDSSVSELDSGSPADSGTEAGIACSDAGNADRFTVSSNGVTCDNRTAMCWIRSVQSGACTSSLGLCPTIGNGTWKHPTVEQLKELAHGTVGDSGVASCSMPILDGAFSGRTNQVDLAIDGWFSFATGSSVSNPYGGTCNVMCWRY